jgi:alkylation response protein AidB-like acyl-CoA dehydrogenase
VFTWFVPSEHAGQSWSARQIAEGYLQLSGACLTTTFVITQLTGACRRIAAAVDSQLPARLLPGLLAGETFATLGISHLTTSRRHLKRPVLTAEETDAGYLLNGFSPWVTGACEADYLVTGATMDDGRQLLAVVPTELTGVTAQEPARLVALNGSRTGAVNFDNVEIACELLLCEPHPDVMQLGIGGRTGGLQTSTLALGLASSAVNFMKQQSDQRADLIHPAEQLEAELLAARERLLELCDGEGDSAANSQLRADANSLVLRATQASLVAAKGAGYVAGHPAGRWCLEALFFLVWSCPQPVLDANLCELAGLRDA